MDFPDEEVDFLADGDVAERIREIGAQLAAVRREAGQGVLLTDGIHLVLAGAPNAGKSSLMNALLRRDAAIVTEIPGTTRDVLRERIDLDGLPVHLVDTAGLRESVDPVEVEGLRRARAEISRGDCLLYIVDASIDGQLPASREEVRELIGAEAPREIVLVCNKIDLLAGEWLPPAAGTQLPVAPLSALTGAGLEALVELLKQRVGFAAEQESTFTARARHLDALDRAAAALGEAGKTLAGTGAGDLVAEDLRVVHDHLGEIVGAMTADELLGRIFSSFCIGK